MSGIEFIGGDRAIANFEDLVNTLNNPTAMMAKIGAVMQKSITENFAAGGRPSSWTPNQKGTTTLVKSGKLRDSFLKASAVKVAGQSVTIGTTVYYGRFHNFGIGGMKKRQFILQPEEISEDVIAIQATVAQTIKGAITK
jgi:phage gpG-like protein